MKKKNLLPNSPVRSVRADTSIGTCVRILRDNSIGALIVTSDDSHEELIGIFTERDLVKHIEIIQHGDFWDRSVRTVMTSNLRTITVDKLHEAPKIMVKYRIRHLPVVETSGGKTRVVGVMSMRDLFRIVMEEINFDLENLYEPAPKRSSKQKTLGVISKDNSVIELVGKAAEIHPTLNVKKMTSDSPFLESATLNGVLLDIDDLTTHTWASIVKTVISKKNSGVVLLAFNPVTMSDKNREALLKLNDSKKIHLLSKPLAIGLLFEKIIKEI